MRACLAPQCSVRPSPYAMSLCQNHSDEHISESHLAAVANTRAGHPPAQHVCANLRCSFEIINTLVMRHVSSAPDWGVLSLERRPKSCCAARRTCLRIVLIQFVKFAYFEENDGVAEMALDVPVRLLRRCGCKKRTTPKVLFPERRRRPAASWHLTAVRSCCEQQAMHRMAPVQCKGTHLDERVKHRA